MINLQLGIDALESLKQIPEEIWARIDFINWDPPYYDSDNDDHKEIVNERSKLKTKPLKIKGNYEVVTWDKPHTRLMNGQHRADILTYIRKHKSPIARIAHFASKKELLTTSMYGVGIACEHVWVKTIEGTMAGNNDRNNGEYIVIEGRPLKGKIKGQILNKYIPLPFEWKTTRKTTRIVRACAKPEKLYSELYRHFDAKYVLDVFAGWGRSISAAIHKNIGIWASDMDRDLGDQWDYYEQYIPLQEYFGEI